MKTSQYLLYIDIHVHVVYIVILNTTAYFLLFELNIIIQHTDSDFLLLSASTFGIYEVELESSKSYSNKE